MTGDSGPMRRPYTEVNIVETAKLGIEIGMSTELSKNGRRRTYPGDAPSWKVYPAYVMLLRQKSLFETVQTF